MAENFYREQIDSLGKSIEILWAKPDVQKQVPLVICVHGHTLDGSGAEIHLNFLRKQFRINRWGVCFASVSQPGYGNSDGPADYCGPTSQSAIHSAINFFRSKEFVDPNKVILIGYSRGAITSAMVATRDPKLAAVVLGAGFYSFKKYYEVAPVAIQEAIRRETKLTEEEFKLRSALTAAEQIRSPLLVFHGNLDERGGAHEAIEL